jgi:hypothetical protein
LAHQDHDGDVLAGRRITSGSVLTPEDQLRVSAIKVFSDQHACCGAEAIGFLERPEDVERRRLRDCRNLAS